jgi:large conductance mechanosensitive channel
MLKDFKEFALKGNVVDLAVGVIIGGAFGKIVESLVGDVFMPVVGAIAGGLDFTNYYIPLSSTITGNPSYADAKNMGAALGYGSFITIAINFLIVAFILFMVVKAMNKLKKEQAAAPAAPAEPSSTDKLLMEIRDTLKK